MSFAGLGSPTTPPRSTNTSSSMLPQPLTCCRRTRLLSARIPPIIKQATCPSDHRWRTVHLLLPLSPSDIAPRCPFNINQSGNIYVVGRAERAWQGVSPGNRVGKKAFKWTSFGGKQSLFLQTEYILLDRNDGEKVRIWLHKIPKKICRQISALNSMQA